ncbi:MAG TPA: ATP-binding protein [Leptospiraceae bacterium]|nr:ATP-binding protein [Leptospiraceae bacterium]HMX30819.1 ATP-binding protein [Leptospiraceae bacterium]HMY30107.1 ATP-binding protein [Leptospiraceae bacterium]HMZ65455.1 ATP-binding protein [Leptospiraceae bacterium]HNA07232.1 ATP-binding protein [Leptospiraceae bacterium]
MKHSIIFSFLLFAFTSSYADCEKLLNSFDEPVNLKAGWVFMKGDNPEWKNSDMEDSTWAKKTLPDSGYDPNPDVMVTGYHWYRCHILLPENIKESSISLAVNLGKIRDVDEVFFNGARIGATGKVTPVLQADLEKDRIYSISSRLLEPGKNVLAVRIYTSTDYFGIDSVPILGNEFALQRKNTRKEIFNIISGFVFIAMGLFFIIGSVVRSTNKSNLFFSLFSIILGMYTIIRTQFRYRIFEDFSLSYRVELILLMILPILFVNFITYFVNHKRKLHNWIYEAVMVVLMLLTWFAKTPEKWETIVRYNGYLLLYPLIRCFYIISKNYIQNKSRLKYIFVGTLALLPCVVVDLLKALEFIKFPSIVHFGFMFFLINISIQLSEEMVENYNRFLNQESDLKKMEKSKTKFLVNLSNEFKVYMDGIHEVTKEILSSHETKDTQDKIRRLESYEGLTRSIISDAVVLNAVEGKKYENVIEKFSLKDLVNDTITMIETRLAQKRKSKSVTISSGDVELMQSRELVFLIFYHLLENVYKYTPENSGYQVLIQTDGKTSIEITIADEGNGIDSMEQIDIQKKFVRGSSVNEKIMGVGIGLTLVKAISNYLGGGLEIQSAKGTGSKFIVTIPV